MKELLLQFSAYNVWANQLIFDTMLQLPVEKQTQEVPSSFSSLLKTVVHMWDAESIWWQRMKLYERVSFPSESFQGDLSEASANLLRQNRQWNEWLVSAPVHALEHEFIYMNTKKELFKQPVFQVMLHVFNHGTYHRGQLVNMMRQLGVTKIPQTDFIHWSRKKQGK